MEGEKASAAGALAVRQAGNIRGDDYAVGRLVEQDDAVYVGMQRIAAEIRPRLPRFVQQDGQRM